MLMHRPQHLLLCWALHHRPHQQQHLRAFKKRAGEERLHKLV
jgi:hypothetical protein